MSGHPYHKWTFWLHLGVRAHIGVATCVFLFFIFRSLVFSFIPLYVYVQGDRPIQHTLVWIYVALGMIWLRMPRRWMHQLFSMARWRYQKHLITLIDHHSLSAPKIHVSQFIRLDQRLIFILDSVMCEFPQMCGSWLMCSVWWYVLDPMMLGLMCIWTIASWSVCLYTQPSADLLRRQLLQVEGLGYQWLDGLLSNRIVRFFHHDPLDHQSLDTMIQDQVVKKKMWHQCLQLSQWVLWLLSIAIIILRGVLDQKDDWNPLKLLAYSGVFWSMLQQQQQWFWWFSNLRSNWADVSGLMNGLQLDTPWYPKTFKSYRFDGLSICEAFINPQVRCRRPLNKRVDAGQTTAIIGPNGSGKSTLLKALSGMIQPSTGYIWGHSGSNRLPISKFRSDMAYLPQSTDLFPQTIWYHLTYWNPQLTPQKAHAILQSYGIGHWLEALDWLDPGVLGKLSGGQKRLILLARVILSNRSIWLLDEPTNHLDLSTQNQFYQVLKQASHHTIFMVTHPVQTDIFDDVWHLS